LLLSIEFGLVALLISLPGGVLWMFLRSRQDLSQKK
jgi:hypothetical protein